MFIQRHNPILNKPTYKNQNLYVIDHDKEIDVQNYDQNT